MEVCINIRDENQNLVWPIYSSLKASSRKPKYSSTLGGLELNVPGLGTRLSVQKMKIDVFLVLDAEFKTRAFSVAKADARSTPGEKGSNSSASTVLLHHRSTADGFLLHSTPSQFAGFISSSLVNNFFSSQVFLFTCLMYANTCLKACTFPVWKMVKCIGL